MGQINGWSRKEKSSKGHASPSWKKGDNHIWVYQNKKWTISSKTGNVDKTWTTHYTVQAYSEGSRKIAHSIGGKKFKTKADAVKFARKQLKRR
jgi:hypothetical protein